MKFRRLTSRFNRFVYMATCLLMSNLALADQAIRFSTVPFIGSTPTNVAQALGYFEDEGLDVRMTNQPGGWRALQDLFEGRADIAAVSDLPIVYSMFDKQKYTNFDRDDFVVFGDLIYSQDIQKLVVRSDRNIASPGDLVGKKIGLMRKSTIDYYMDTFFLEYELDTAKTNLVDMDTFQLIEAVIAGELDGAFTWEPHVSALVEALDGHASVLSTNSNHSTAWLMVTTRKFAKDNPETLVSFLQAILQAEQFISVDREAAIKIQAEMTNTDARIISRLFDVVDFDLSLGEALISTMEGQAHWLIRKGEYTAADFPNFLDVFDLEPLRRVKPLGIGIIH